MEKLAAPHLVAVLPTYNNAGTIADVVRRVYAVMEHIIVVADGPTDNTLDELHRLDIPFTLVHYPVNKGKGHALKCGFSKAREMGFTHVVTLDTDGQHFPEDIPLLYRMHAIHPEAIVLGVRGLEQENMPGKNTFANKFSNFWFTVQTGQRLHDTQCGFRIYPLDKVRGERLMTNRYEAELTLLAFSSWANVQIASVPIRVFYPKKEERVSHFRPAYDFTRISILNTLLCVIALVYGLPRRWVPSALYGLFFILDAFLVLNPALLYLLLRYGNTPKAHERLHGLMQRNARFLLSHIPYAKFRMRLVEHAEPLEENRPSVIIANHNSLLDILCMMTLHKKIAIVTKDWVTHNVFYGRIAQNFDIIPLKDAIDNFLPAVQEKIEQGFSVMIFPEGTRSQSGELGHFYRGAFFVAERLNLPVRPILIRGTWAALRKKEVHVYDTKEVGIHIMPEIRPGENGVPKDHAELTRWFRNYYRDHIDTLKYPYND